VPKEVCEVRRYCTYFFAVYGTLKTLKIAMVFKIHQAERARKLIIYLLIYFLH